MRLKTLLAGSVAALGLSIGVLGLTVGQAWPHTPNYSENCDGIQASGASYPSGSHVTLTVDGKTVLDEAFSPSFSVAKAWDDTVSHTFHLVIFSPDGTGNVDWAGTQQACKPPTTQPTTTVPTTVPVTTIPTTVPKTTVPSHTCTSTDAAGHPVKLTTPGPCPTPVPTTTPTTAPPSIDQTTVSPHPSVCTSTDLLPGGVCGQLPQTGATSGMTISGLVGLGLLGGGLVMVAVTRKRSAHEQ